MDAAQKRRLAATGRSDERGHRSRRDFKSDIVQHLIRAVGEIDIAHIDHHRGRFGFLNRSILLARALLGQGFGRHFNQAYHDKRLRWRSLSKIEVNAITMTTTRNTNAVPYCTRSVYSFC